MLRALIAEDETVLANNIKTCLEHEEFDRERFEVDLAENGAVALSLLRNKYDLVILDLKMPEVDGTQVIETLKEMRQKKPLVVLITAYPRDYDTAHIGVKMGVQALLQKPFELAELMGIVRELIQSRRQLLYLEREGLKSECNWTLMLSDAGTAFIQVEGLLNSKESCSLSLTQMDFLAASQQAETASTLFTTIEGVYGNAKLQAKNLGTNFFGKLFMHNIQDSFIAASNVVSNNSDLKLTFVGPRHSLKFPFEFLHDGSDYLILKHPVKRFLTGIRSRGNIGLSHLLNELRDKREKLRILLVASNTPPRIDSADEEVATLYEWLHKSLPKKDFTVDYIPTEKATYEEVMRRLKGCTYHILHYAGHGYHNENFPEKSCLYFWEKEGCQGKARELSINTLKNTLLMKGHSLRFIYLSSCSSTGTSDENMLLKDNFLGMTDGLIIAKVPSVLGFRWPVSDTGAKELALTFYESLFEQGNLDTALFDARCKVAGSEEQAICDWLSPILIVQG